VVLRHVADCLTDVYVAEFERRQTRILPPGAASESAGKESFAHVLYLLAAWLVL